MQLYISEMKARCMKCKAEREMKDVKQSPTPRGAIHVTGKCTSCGTKMSTFTSGKKGKGEEDDYSGGAQKATKRRTRSRSRKSRRSRK